MSIQRKTDSILRRVNQRIRKLCRSRPLLSALLITSVSVVLISAAFGVLSPTALKDPILTTAITASTQSFQFVAPSGRQSAWSLPPGQFSIVGTVDSEKCTTVGFESLCNYESNTRLVVDGAAEIAMQVSPDGGWLVSVAETSEESADVSLYDAAGSLLMRSEHFIQFHTDSTTDSIRVPFVAESVVIGSDLHQSSSIDGSAYDFWQPILLSGDVVMIADNKPGREKYTVLNERVDPGDVVHIGQHNESTLHSQKPKIIWGMVTVQRSGSAGSLLHVVLRSSTRDVSVSRFGAPEGHLIRASTWAILQKWPNGQSVWVLFVTMTFLLSFVLGLADRFSKIGGEADVQSGQDLLELENEASPSKESSV